MTATDAKALALVAVGKIEARSAAERQQRENIRQSMLTDHEAETLILSAMQSRGDMGLPEREGTDMLNECIAARFIACCVDLAAKGLISINYNPANPVGERLVFTQREDIKDTLREVINRRDQGGQ